MVAFRHLVVGLDLAPRSGALTAGTQAALAHARWLAEGAGVRCTLLHSETPDEHWDPETKGYEAGGSSARRSLEVALAELRAAGIDAELEVSAERAALAIIRRVIEGPCDLVLVGKRAGADPEGPPVGSTATKLLRKCPCAVWAVRPRTLPPPVRVLAATDLSPVGRKVIERAAQVATRAGAELHVLHAIQLSMEAQLGRGETAESYVAGERARVSREIRAVLEAVGCSAETHLHEGVSSPTRAILEGVERIAPDLVVMGTVSRGGIPGWLLGNTAERLFSRLDRSLLTLKPADFVCPVSLD